MKKKIFVVGTGRSGTHWLGYILESSPEIKMNIEVKPIFPWVTQAAIDTSKRRKLLPLIRLYYNGVSKLTRKHYADKSHPNLWHIDYLFKNVPNSYFIGIIREPHATVSSMLLHPGVRAWCENWQNFPVPNEFLGITEENKGEYETLPIEAKCTLRWIAHKKRLDQANVKYPNNLLIVDYNKLFEDTEHEIHKINQFLELKKPLPYPQIKSESKNKWKNNLSETQINNINKILIKHDFNQYVV